MSLCDYDDNIIGWDDLSKKEQLYLIESCQEFIDYFTPYLKK